MAADERLGDHSSKDGECRPSGSAAMILATLISGVTRREGLGPVCAFAKWICHLSLLKSCFGAERKNCEIDDRSRHLDSLDRRIRSKGRELDKENRWTAGVNIGTRSGNLDSL